MSNQQQLCPYDVDLQEIKSLLEGRNVPIPGLKPPGERGDKRWYRLPHPTHIPNTNEVLKIIMRILPKHPKQVQNIPGKIVFQHFNLPGEKSAITCFRTYKMDCPLCNLIQSYVGRVDLKDWAAKQQGCFNVLILQDVVSPRIDPKLAQLFSCSDSFFWWVMDILMNPAKGGSNLINPNNGYNIELNRKKDKGAIEKNLLVQPTAIAQTQPEIDQILGSVYNLDEVWSMPDDSYVQRMNESVVMLRNSIEQRIANLSQGLGNNQPQTAQQYPPQNQTFSPQFPGGVQPTQPVQTEYQPPIAQPVVQQNQAFNPQQPNQPIQVAPQPAPIQAQPVQAQIAPQVSQMPQNQNIQPNPVQVQLQPIQPTQVNTTQTNTQPAQTTTTGPLDAAMNNALNAQAQPVPIQQTQPSPQPTAPTQQSPAPIQAQVAPQPTPIQPQPIAPVQQQTTQVQTQGNKPCFGDINTYDLNKSECEECLQQYECGRALAG